MISINCFLSYMYHDKKDEDGGYIFRDFLKKYYLCASKL